MIRITLKMDDQPEQVHEVDEYILFGSTREGNTTRISGSITATEHFKRIAYFELMQAILDQASADRKAGEASNDNQDI